MTSNDGHPVKRCIRYLRVSSVRQTYTDADVTDDGNSIDTQRRACQANEKRLGLVCVGEYIEPGTSAQSIMKRKVFRQVLKRLYEERDAEYLSIYMRSRAFRDYIEAGATERQLAEIGVTMTSAKEDYGDDLNGQLMKAMTDVINWYEVRRNGADIQEKMANKVKNGGTPSIAPLGYLNVTVNSEGRKINSIAFDEERKPLVIAAFELCATGEYTLKQLLAKLTAMGLRSKPTKRFPAGKPIGLETLRKLLRNRYYIGWVDFKGVEYQGRHETFISEELFNRVQRVLDSHSGAGVRERKHPHYLKGWLYCQRCGNRFIIQRAVGRQGGEYFYFFCASRQDNACDQPYVPIEKMEDAIAKYYAARVWLPEAVRAELRAMVDEAASESYGLTGEMRDQFTRRLDALDKKENYLLDLAAEEGWPKDKLREKIAAIRTERQDIQHQLNRAETQLDAGTNILHKALELLDKPAEMYAEGDEQVRAILNKAFFHKFLVDGRKVVGGELKEPFDTLTGAMEREAVKVYLREAGLIPESAGMQEWARGRRNRPQIAGSPVLVTENRANAEESSLTDLLELAWLSRARGSSKPVMVGATGFEPVTSAL